MGSSDRGPEERGKTVLLWFVHATLNFGRKYHIGPADARLHPTVFSLPAGALPVRQRGR